MRAPAPAAGRGRSAATVARRSRRVPLRLNFPSTPVRSLAAPRHRRRSRAARRPRCPSSSAPMRRPDYLRACLAGLAGAVPPGVRGAGGGQRLAAGARPRPSPAWRRRPARGCCGRTSRACPARGTSGWPRRTGSWVAFLDDDAVPEPGWAAALLARIATLPDARGGARRAHPAGLGGAPARLVAALAPRRAHHHRVGGLRRGRRGPAGGRRHLRRQHGLRRRAAPRGRRLPGSARPGRRPAALRRGGGGGGEAARPAATAPSTRAPRRCGTASSASGCGRAGC